LHEELAAKRTSLAEMESFRRQRLAQLQAELTQLTSIYAANHPSVIAAKRALDAISDPPPRVTELQSEIDEIEREVARRGVRVSAARPLPGEPFMEARLRLDAEDPRLDFDRGQLENLLRQHAELRNRIQNVQLEQEMAEAAFRHRYSVVAPPQLPRGPIKPYKVVFLVGGFLGGLAFAFFSAAAADIRSGRIIERWEIEQLDLPVLAELHD
jgi:capsule polysaccharide export protein KpsE/RkpR